MSDFAIVALVVASIVIWLLVVISMKLQALCEFVYSVERQLAAISKEPTNGLPKDLQRSLDRIEEHLTWIAIEPKKKELDWRRATDGTPGTHDLDEY